MFSQGVAMGVGLCANSHLEGTLAKLDEFGKSDAFKKSPSIFNLLKVLFFLSFLFYIFSLMSRVFKLSFNLSLFFLLDLGA